MTELYKLLWFDFLFKCFTVGLLAPVVLCTITWTEIGNRVPVPTIPHHVLHLRKLPRLCNSNINSITSSNNTHNTNNNNSNHNIGKTGTTNYANKVFLKFNRRYMAEILPMSRKTLFNQSIDQSWNSTWKGKKQLFRSILHV